MRALIIVFTFYSPFTDILLEGFGRYDYISTRAIECRFTMTSRVSIDMTICSHKTQIYADLQDDGSVKVRFNSTCQAVREFAERLDHLLPADYLSFKDSNLMRLVSESNLTPTCLIPAGIYNVVWMEVGMISKRYAQKAKSICIHFDEEQDVRD